MMAPGVNGLAAFVLLVVSTLPAAATPSIVGRWQELNGHAAAGSHHRHRSQRERLHRRGRQDLFGDG